MPKALILDCTGPVLTAEERAFFAAADPLGFILFARHIETPEQVRRLIEDLRASVGRPDAPVLIDQEGGRVQRLKPPHWRSAPPAEVFGRLAQQDLAKARKAVYLNHRLLAGELAALGITVDCAPVIDLRHPGAHDVIGNRSFGSDPVLVADLGRAAMDGLMAGGVQPIVKHIPGHGRALVDSHIELPRCDAGAEALAGSDFLPFRLLRDAPWAMTAHVLYTAIDPKAPATTSPSLVEQVIRGQIGFDGLLISDDLSMRALAGDMAEHATAAQLAGCDVLLLCNAGLEERRAVAAVAQPLSPYAVRRLAAAEARCRAAAETAAPLDPTGLLRALDGLLAAA